MWDGAGSESSELAVIFQTGGLAFEVVHHEIGQHSKGEVGLNLLKTCQKEPHVEKLKIQWPCIDTPAGSNPKLMHPRLVYQHTHICTSHPGEAISIILYSPCLILIILISPFFLLVQCCLVVLISRGIAA